MGNSESSEHRPERAASRESIRKPSEVPESVSSSKQLSGESLPADGSDKRECSVQGNSPSIPSTSIASTQSDDVPDNKEAQPMIGSLQSSGSNITAADIVQAALLPGNLSYWTAPHTAQSFDHAQNAVPSVPTEIRDIGDTSEDIASCPASVMLPHNWSSMSDDKMLDELHYLHESLTSQLTLQDASRRDLSQSQESDLMRRHTDNEAPDLSQNEVSPDQLRCHLSDLTLYRTLLTLNEPQDVRYSATSPEILSALNDYDKTTGQEQAAELTEEQIQLIPLDAEGKLTSIGSRFHHLGQCRPCAFKDNPKRDPCSNGIACTFCHFSHGKKKRGPRLSKHQRALRKWTKRASQSTNDSLCEEGDALYRCLLQANPNGLTGFERPISASPNQETGSYLSQQAPPNAGQYLLSLMKSGSPTETQASPLTGNAYSQRNSIDDTASPVIYVLSGGNPAGLYSSTAPVPDSAGYGSPYERLFYHAVPRSKETPRLSVIPYSTTRWSVVDIPPPRWSIGAVPPPPPRWIPPPPPPHSIRQWT